MRLPPHPEGTLVEFWRRRHRCDRSRPDVSRRAPTDTGRTANLVYQVDSKSSRDPTAVSHSPPQGGVRLPEEDLERSTRQRRRGQRNLHRRGWAGPEGAAAQVRYLSSFRNRGHGTRVSVPHNFRVNFPKDRLWQGREGINLNTQFTPAQVLGSMIMRRARLPMAESRRSACGSTGRISPAGSPQFGSYAANELVDDSPVERQFPETPTEFVPGHSRRLPGNPGGPSPGTAPTLVPHQRVLQTKPHHRERLAGSRSPSSMCSTMLPTRPTPTPSDRSPTWRNGCAISR